MSKSHSTRGTVHMFTTLSHEGSHLMTRTIRHSNARRPNHVLAAGTVLLLLAAATTQAATLNDLDDLATGTHSFSGDGESFQGFVDNDGTHGWLLVGRGREG